MSFSQWKRRFEREQLAAAVPDRSERAALVEVQLADAPPPDDSNLASDAVNFPTLTAARERAPKSTSTET